MKQHKWAKEIKAWADGEKVEKKPIDGVCWYSIDGLWDFERSIFEFRIKPQPKEPQYLYVSDGVHGVQLWREKQYIDNPSQYNIGRIKLEVDDE